MVAEGAQSGGGNMFADLLLIFATALIMVAACRPARLPGTLGYFVAGALLGPTGLGLIHAGADIQLLAEFGVVLLLFSLGLEFSLPRLMAMRRSVFGVGLLQVALTGALFALVLGLGYVDWGLAVLIGGGLALSSTALVSRELVLTGQLHMAHGRQALGVLLFQDLFAVFLLILIPVLGSDSDVGLGETALILGGKGVVLFVGLMLMGRYLLPPVFTEIARSRSSELFVLAALVVVMAAAWLTHELGLSMALGGFVGGMMLGESHYRHQVQADIRPFRDILLGLFLVTVGMMLDLDLLLEYWPRILAFGLLLMVIKAAVILAISLAFGDSLRVAMRTGLVLAQGGEFAFAMLALAAGANLVEPDVQAFMVAVTLVSMVLTPTLVRRSGTLVDRILGREEQEGRARRRSARAGARRSCGRPAARLRPRGPDHRPIAGALRHRPHGARFRAGAGQCRASGRGTGPLRRCDLPPRSAGERSAWTRRSWWWSASTIPRPLARPCPRSGSWLPPCRCWSAPARTPIWTN
ncbi:MAG: cation:proton antiporter [Gammaproteobacteria bacterium]|nr:cation:proton antiporter [Gammaproteobacteria bacterium]